MGQSKLTKYTIQSSTTDEPAMQQSVAPRAVQTLDLSWSAPILHGDCKLSGLLDGTLNKGPTLRLQSDGTAELLAIFFSSSSGDAWLITGLDLQDNHGVTLFTIPRFASPGTTTDRQSIDWTPNLVFPAVFFSSITQANMHHHC
jgi:hypothetical protein